MALQDQIRRIQTAIGAGQCETGHRAPGTRVVGSGACEPTQGREHHNR